jgi:hypothetical protein
MLDIAKTERLQGWCEPAAPHDETHRLPQTEIVDQPNHSWKIMGQRGGIGNALQLANESPRPPADRG